MDSIVAHFPGKVDEDLAFCDAHGVAYQLDMESGCVEYGKQYLEKYRGYEGSQIAQRINAARLALVARHYRGPLLDIGVGSGEFLRQCPDGSRGFDVNPWAVEMLKKDGLHAEKLERFSAFTFWDTLEHVSDPDEYFRQIPMHSYVFVSLPIFEDLADVRASKHYRPGEHFYYWTARGFVDWMAKHGFRLVEQNMDETLAGRESIGSFAFIRDIFDTEAVSARLAA